MTTETTAAEPLNQRERAACMGKLGQVVQLTGNRILKMTPKEILNTKEVSGHQFSTVDDLAKLVMRGYTRRRLVRMYRFFLEESDIPRGNLAEEVRYPLVVGDAVEGSTNATRGLRNAINNDSNRPIMAGSAMMLLENPKLGSIAATAFYDWAARRTYSSMRGEPGEFLAFLNSKLLTIDDIKAPTTNSQIYAIVPGYSHSNIQERALTEIALLDAGIRCTGGSRSSAQDLLDLIGGQADAYVDLRLFFHNSSDNRDEVLRAWDVGALLPLLDGLGFVATTSGTQNWQDSNFSDDLSLVVARTPELWKKITTVINQLPFMAPEPKGEHRISVPMPPPSFARTAT